MPFDTLAEARESDFPTQLSDVDLTLGQINWLARVFDAIRDEGDAENPMAVAISQFRNRYRIEGRGSDRRYVLRDRKELFETVEEAKIADALTEIDGNPLTLEQINMFTWWVSEKVANELVLRNLDGIQEKLPQILEGCKARFLEEFEWNAEEGKYLNWWEAQERLNRSGKRAKAGDVLKSDTKRRMALQAIWVPNLKDRDNEWVSGEEIEKGFYRNAIRKAKLVPSETGINHEGDTIEGIYTVQDYLAPTDLEIDGVTIPKGSHIREHHFDPESKAATDVWEGILEGKFRGVSPQGDWKGRLAPIPKED